MRSSSVLDLFRSGKGLRAVYGANEQVSPGLNRCVAGVESAKFFGIIIEVLGGGVDAEIGSSGHREIGESSAVDGCFIRPSALWPPRGMGSGSAISAVKNRICRK